MWPGVIFDEDSRVGEALPPVALDILNFALMAWSWQEQGAPPGLADPKAPLFALVGRERGDPHLSEPSLLPRVEEAPLVTPTDSHLKDKDLRGNVVEVDHIGEGNPHAQESCRKERSKQFSWETVPEHHVERSQGQSPLCIVTLSSRHPGGGGHYYHTHFTE